MPRDASLLDNECEFSSLGLGESFTQYDERKVLQAIRQIGTNNQNWNTTFGKTRYARDIIFGQKHGSFTGSLHLKM